MLNVAVLMGRLVANPELRHTASDIAVCSFRIAVDRNFSSRSGERQADFIDIVAWRQTAEFVCRYFTKGQMIAVNGSIQTRSYEDKQGNKRTAVEVVADNVSFCGSKRESEGGAGGYGAGGYASDGYSSGDFGFGDGGNVSKSPASASVSYPDGGSSSVSSVSAAPAFPSGDDDGLESIFSDDDLPF